MVAQVRGGFFGDGCVYFNASAELKAGKFRKTGQDFDVPAKMLEGGKIAYKAGVIAGS